MRRHHPARIAAAVIAPPLLFVSAIAALAPTLEPAGLLSGLDRLCGGGWGVTRTGSGIPFGTHGQRLDIWAPTASKGRLPIIVFFYGGGWVKGGREDYAFAARALASRGFVVVVPDYRKVPQVRFPAFIEDGAEAVAWTRAHASTYWGDPNRIALAGHSAGAHTAVMLALDRRYLAAQGLPASTIKAVVGLSGPYDFYPYTGRAIAAMAGAGAAETQPVRLVRGDAPPMLLVTGDADTTVRPRNAINLAGRLKALGVPATLKVYRGLGHEDTAMALSRPFRGKGDILAASADFLHTTMPRFR